MKKFLSILLLIGILTVSCASAVAEGKYVWYFPAAHAYADEVMGYVETFTADTGIEVRTMIGSDWEQSTEDANLQALVADGYTNISCYPSTDGAAGLFDELKSFGVNVVCYGAGTSQGTEDFVVATDVEAAAYAACGYVIDAMGGSGGILDVLEVLTDTNTLKRKDGVDRCIAEHDGVELIQEVAGINSIDEGVEKISSALYANIESINGIVCTGNQSSSAAVQVLDDYYARNPDADKIYLVTIDTPDDVMNGIRSGVVYGTIAQNTFAHGYIPMQILTMMNDGYKKVEGTYFIDSGCVLVTVDNIDAFGDDLQAVTDQIIADLPNVYLTK
ncbi:MAG: substrate-binding domain-containing protein [Clostridia bacterium]|nr:substrate-binding domain-containing protein [Clostridia bacterium]